MTSLASLHIQMLLIPDAGHNTLQFTPVHVMADKFADLIPPQWLIFILASWQFKCPAWVIYYLNYRWQAVTTKRTDLSKLVYMANTLQAGNATPVGMTCALPAQCMIRESQSTWRMAKVGASNAEVLKDLEVALMVAKVMPEGYHYGSLLVL